MASSSKGQRAAKKRRALKRELGREQGRRPPIIVRHTRGTGKRKKKEEEKKWRQPAIVYQLVLTRGPGYSYEFSSWESNITLWCNKTEREAAAIIIRAMRNAELREGNPPVLISCNSTSDADIHRLRFDPSIRAAIEIVEKVPA